MYNPVVIISVKQGSQTLKLSETEPKKVETRNLSNTFNNRGKGVLGDLIHERTGVNHCRLISFVRYVTHETYLRDETRLGFPCNLSSFRK